MYRNGTSIQYHYNGSVFTVSGGNGSGATDHGALDGLADDDHSQYHNDGRADTWLAEKEETTYPITMTVNTGTLIEGVVGNLVSANGSIVNIQETTGADPLRVSFTFTGLTLDPNNLIFYSRYNGGSGHVMVTEIYNMVSLAWDGLGEFTNEAGYEWHTYPIYQGSNYVNGSGEAEVRFRHVNNGVATHYLYIDYLALRSSFGFGGGTGDVIGPTTATDGNVAVFNGTTGKVIKDGGFAPASASTKLDDWAAPDDNTDLNVGTSAHGLCPKAPNDTTKFLRGDATWAVPTSSGLSQAQALSLISRGPF
jgi:hypothetical protein